MSKSYTIVYRTVILAFNENDKCLRLLYFVSYVNNLYFLNIYNFSSVFPNHL